jgi:acyl carrier protein
MSALDDAKEILATCLFVPADSIADDAVITDIKSIDSLAFETIMLEVEERTGRDVDPIKMLELSTVADLAGMLEVRP